MNNKIIRKKLTISGRVQGVGFRFRAQMAASRLGLTGWVRNEYDDTVSMEVQGRTEDIDMMLQMLNQGTFIMMEAIRAKEIPVVEDERSFRVRGY